MIRIKYARILFRVAGFAGVFKFGAKLRTVPVCHVMDLHGSTRDSVREKRYLGLSKGPVPTNTGRKNLLGLSVDPLGRVNWPVIISRLVTKFLRGFS